MSNPGVDAGSAWSRTLVAFQQSAAASAPAIYKQPLFSRFAVTEPAP